MDAHSIQPATEVGGTFDVPGDKSISHRAVILGALSNRRCQVDNFLAAEDCLCTLEAFQRMGVRAERSGERLQIEGRGLDGLSRPAEALWCGNSGTTTRLLFGVLTGQPFEARLEGDASLSRRPMDRVVEPLSKMGAFFNSQGPDSKGSDPAVWQLPMRIQGTRSVRSLDWKSPVASAQVKSAILLAGLYASGTTTFEEPSLSRDHTERMLSSCGVALERKGLCVKLRGGAPVRASAFCVPGDLSSAAFVLAAGLLLSRGGVRVRGVGVNPTRTGLIDIVKAMGAQIRFDKATERSGEPVADIEVRLSSLRGTSISGDVVPRAIDEFPIVTVLATQARGRTEISGARELRIKESDRIASIAAELRKMGAHIMEKDDGLTIEGPTPLRGAVVQSHGDHRLAMSLAVAALVAQGTTTIENTDCVKTSFPGFWAMIDALRTSA